MSMTLGFHSYDVKSVPGENSKLVLVRGEREYSGNDKNRDLLLM